MNVKRVSPVFLAVMFAVSTTITLSANISATPANTVWTERIPPTPLRPHWAHAMTFDSRRGVTVLFGGSIDPSGTLAGDTWELSGRTWSERTPTNAPSPRYQHAMAYDPIRGETVLFGGNHYPNGLLGDTWVWDGQTWSPRNPGSSPSPRYGHAMAFDINRGVIVLFGGYNGTDNLNDTWEWNGVNWIQMNPAVSPSPRNAAAMAYDASRGVMVLAGGFGPSADDTWEWDGTNWTQRSTGQMLQSGSMIAYDSVVQRVVLFGGENNGQSFGDVLEWDGTSGNWIQASYSGGPQPRAYGGMVFDSVRGVSILFGGEERTTAGLKMFQDTWAWNTALGTWTRIVPVVSPLPTANSALVYDSTRHQGVLFGGVFLYDETWTWNGVTGQWTQAHPTDNPSARAYHAMAFDSHRGVSVLFGGYASGTFFDDTWEWDGNNWIARHPANSPPSRSEPGMAYDSGRGVTVLFGGRRGSLYGDTWEWDGINWTQRFPIHSPSPRCCIQLAYDSARGVTVLFSGGTIGDINDTWEWDGTDWTLRTPANSPPPLAYPNMAYDQVRHVTVLFGGGTGSQPNQDDTWEWDGTNWTQQTLAVSPSGREASGFTYDTDSESILMFGGSTNSGGVDDTWEYGTALSANQPPIVSVGGPYSVNEGDFIDLTAVASDPDHDPITYAWDLDNNGSFETPGQSIQFSAAQLDGPSNYTVTVLATDSGGLTTTRQATINVLNVPPTVGPIVAPVDPVQVNTVVNTSASFTDPGVLDTHTAVWDWGDGTTSAGVVTETYGSGSVSGAHTYSVAGVNTITLTVTDKDGGVGQAIYQYVVVYDANAGFVTGGGWINSLAGAYAPDPTLSGKATFGFVSRYQKGATVPTGQTEFQFQVANLNFHSTSYQWLVIAGAKAQYKGTGTINGIGNYSFMLTAIDGQVNGGGGVDKFRIKIWDSSTGNVVYDNQMGASDTSDPATAISGGSIVIHN